VYLRGRGDWAHNDGRCKSEALECYAQSLFKQIVHSFSLGHDTPRREVVWFAQFPLNYPKTLLDPNTICYAPAILGDMGILMYNQGTPWGPVYRDHPAGEAWSFLSSRLNELGDFDFDGTTTVETTSLYKFTKRQSSHIVAGWCKGVGCSTVIDLRPLFNIPQGTTITVYNYRGSQERQGTGSQVTFMQAPKLIEWAE
jgi:hypothetical protein